MKTKLFLTLCAAFVPALIWGASAKTDILPPSRREATVDTAMRLSRPPAPAPIPESMKNPFNPPSFGGPDPDADPGVPARPTAPDSAAPAPMGARELLETIAARIQPTGSIVARGRPLLTFSGRTPTVGVGQSFVVTYNDQDHELEVIAIDRTTFTLRYRGEEITRPIKPTK